MTMHTAYFERFSIDLTEKDASYGTPPGQDASPRIDDLMREGYIAKQLDKIPADDIRAELKEYGAWDDDHLSNDDVIKRIILWLACGEIMESLK